MSGSDEPKWMARTGTVLWILAGAAMVLSSVFKLMANPQMVTNFTKYGFQPSALRTIGIIELAVGILTLVPRTSLLGVILMAAYFGGAVCTHLRVGEPFIAPIVIAVLGWLGLYLRDSRVRALVPLRQPPAR